ncbi:MAG TPA: CBS domain-containing protein [Chloroflexota bacterium]|nr:CBS domain-containing protein [Chloroflexota bacterium]
MLRLSELLATKVHDQGGNLVGRLSDIVARNHGDQPPLLAGLLVRRSGGDLFCDGAGMEWSTAGAGSWVVRADGVAPFARRSGEWLLAHDLLDHQVIDLREATTARVNDIILTEEGSEGWRLGAVDLATGALIRRCLPSVLRSEGDESRILPWQHFEVLASDMNGGGWAQPEHSRLARLHPADIARITDLLPTPQVLELIESLSDRLAADALEEMDEHLRGGVFAELAPERAARILDRMAPNAAADILAELPAPLARRILQDLPSGRAADIHALLTYAKDTAGGLMTTAYVIAPRTLPIHGAAEFLRSQLGRPDWVYYVYVVEDMAERKLVGVFTLRDLLLAGQDRTVEDIMSTELRTAEPNTPAKKVAQTMSEYNLMALPITDTGGRLLGIVAVDDALAVILPNELRRRVPRVFS